MTTVILCDATRLMNTTAVGAQHAAPAFRVVVIFTVVIY